MAFPDNDEIRQMVQEFCQGMAQMVTHDSKGFPTARTLGGRLQPNWTIDVGTFKGFKRLDQVKRDPRVLFIWAEDSKDAVRKVVFAKGNAEVISGPAVADWYRGLNRPGMTPEQAAEQLELIRVHMFEFRCEGFAKPGTELSREEVRTGMTFRV